MLDPSPSPIFASSHPHPLRVLDGRAFSKPRWMGHGPLLGRAYLQQALRCTRSAAKTKRQHHQVSDYVKWYICKEIDEVIVAYKFIGHLFCFRSLDGPFSRFLVTRMQRTEEIPSTTHQSTGHGVRGRCGGIYKRSGVYSLTHPSRPPFIKRLTLHMMVVLLLQCILWILLT